MVEEKIEAKKTSPGYFKSYNWCPVCGKSLHEDFDYCPMHEGVLTLKVYSYKPKVVEIPMIGVYNAEHDEFDMSAGLVPTVKLPQEDKDWLENAASLSEAQLVKLVAGEMKRRRRKR